MKKQNGNKKFSPGIFITAAFIGPGSVTLCSYAGANYGYTLIWAILFSILATIVLQEMTGRLGILTKNGLGSSIKIAIKSILKQRLMIGLIISAIVIGNAAYEAGNLSGAVVGLESSIGELKVSGYSIYPLIIGTLAFIFLKNANKGILEIVLIGLVLLMSAAFIGAAILSKPSISSIVSSLVPSVPEGGWLTVIGLVGTTIVPYNLFLHASKVTENGDDYTISEMRKDLYYMLPIGGLISICILISAASTFYLQQIPFKSVGDMSIQLEPILGSYGKWCIGFGFFAAGLSSAVTAPLAASYAAKEVFNWEKDGKYFTWMWQFILLIGVLFSTFGIKPLLIIMFAQITNGVLLPVIVGYLIWVMNQKSIMKNQTNSTLQNIISIAVLGICLMMSVKSLVSLF